MQLGEASTATWLRARSVRAGRARHARCRRRVSASGRIIRQLPRELRVSHAIVCSRRERLVCRCFQGPGCASDALGTEHSSEAPTQGEESHQLDIGIIGSGNIGGTLAGHLTALGHRVLIANSRGPASLADIAAKTGATAATVEQAARAQDLAIITIPEEAVPRLPKGILAASSAVVIDTGNYYPSRDGRIAEIEDGLAESEWVARVLGVPVVKAFNNIIAPSLASRGLPS